MREFLGSARARLKRSLAMKINVEVDCTPEEARRAMGLPDLTPIHEKYVSAVTDAMSGTVMKPEAIETMMRSWLPMSDAGMNFWRTLFEQGKTKSD
jgi:hypothetical protein